MKTKRVPQAWTKHLGRVPRMEVSPLLQLAWTIYSVFIEKSNQKQGGGYEKHYLAIRNVRGDLDFRPRCRDRWLSVAGRLV